MKRLIIIGAGNSIRPELQNGLWDKLRNEYTFALNDVIYFFNPTVPIFVDWYWYRDRVDVIDKFPLSIGRYDKKLFATHPEIKVTKVSDNTIFLNPSNNEYHGKDSLKKGVYSGVLCGCFALTIGIALGFKEIYLCFDDKTEVFTKNGWKFFKDLKKEDLILTRKPNGKTEWSTIQNYYEYNYDGYMHKIKSKGIDLLVTPEHKFGINSVDNNEYLWQTVNDFKTTPGRFIPKIFNWKGKSKKYFTLPGLKGKWIKGYDYHKPKKILMSDWLAFLGFFLSEGCTFQNNSYGIELYQTRNKQVDEKVETLLNKLPFHYNANKRSWRIYNKQLHNYLKQFGKSYEKYIPNEIKQLTSNKLKILLDWLVWGDGCINKTSISYFTVSKQLADDVQEIAYKIGYNAEIYQRKGRVCNLSRTGNIGLPQYQINFNKNNKQGNINHISVGNLVFHNNISLEHYTGKVYDITVKNHVIWVRRNKKAVWSGNCGFDFSETNGKTHFYEKDKLEDQTIGVIKEKDGSIRCGIGKDARGFYRTGIYNNIPEKFFNVYKSEKKIKIFNVSTESKIETFPKISYKEFYQRLASGNININQDDGRLQIRQILTNNMEK